MIAVGGFNSAIDKFADVDEMTAGAVIRMRNVRPLAGGKGLHVAAACSTLGESATLVGLSDVATRRLFEEALHAAGGRFVGVDADGPVRTCLALRDPAGRLTELLEPGPTASASTAEALRAAFAAEAAAASFSALSGSLPPGLPPNTYADLIARADRSRVALDTSGAALAHGIDAGPLLIKPNRQEAGQLLGCAIETLEQAAEAGRALAARGPRIVVLSLGHEGALVHADGQSWLIRAPIVTARNTVGAGDCLLGGFLVGLARSWNLETCARYAVACGTAKVMHPETGVLTAADADTVVRSVVLEHIA